MMGGSGRDILCAAISSAAYLAANTITDVIGVKADITVGHGHMRVIVPEDSGQQCDWLLRGLKLHMKELYKQYPNKIKITLRKVQHNA